MFEGKERRKELIRELRIAKKARVERGNWLVASSNSTVVVRFGIDVLQLSLPFLYSYLLFVFCGRRIIS